MRIIEENPFSKGFSQREPVPSGSYAAISPLSGV